MPARNPGSSPNDTTVAMSRTARRAPPCSHRIHRPDPRKADGRRPRLVRMSRLTRASPPCPCREAGLDAALIHSVIDTIPSPNSLLARMGGARGIVRENGGLVVVVSAYDWNEDVTPRGGWLGGYLDKNGTKVSYHLII